MVTLKPPPELEFCSRETLHAFARSCILEFNSQPQLATQLGCTPVDLHDATCNLLDSFLQQGSAPLSLSVKFAHDCRYISCADESCLLCQQSQQRRCTRTFAKKYLSGDTLKAACKASIRVQVVDGHTGAVLRNYAALDGFQIEFFILDGKVTEALGSLQEPSALEEYMILFNHQNQPLLMSRLGSNASGGFVRIPANTPSPVLPDLFITGSSEALLKGQKPPLILAARLLDSLGKPVGVPVLSEGFVVATPRVRTAAKHAILHCSDPVSKINAVGNATQFKLKDLGRAAAEAGLPSFAFPMRSVSCVRDFRMLLEWAEQDGTRCDIMKKILKLTKGWDEAREHVVKAVESDGRLRLWVSPQHASPVGLLYFADGAVPSLERPVALLEVVRGDQTVGGRPQAQCTLVGPEQEEIPEAELSQEIALAQASWFRRGHPGWYILSVESREFFSSCAGVSSVVFSPLLLSSAMPRFPPGSPFAVLADAGPDWGTLTSVDSRLRGSPLAPGPGTAFSPGPALSMPVAGVANGGSTVDLGIGIPHEHALLGGPGVGLYGAEEMRPRAVAAAKLVAPLPWAEGGTIKRPRLESPRGAVMLGQPVGELLDEGDVLEPLGLAQHRSGSPGPAPNILSSLFAAPASGQLRLDVPSLSRLLGSVMGTQVTCDAPFDHGDLGEPTRAAGVDGGGPSGGEDATHVDYEEMLRAAYRPEQPTHVTHTVRATPEIAEGVAPLESTRSAIERVLRAARDRGPRANSAGTGLDGGAHLDDMPTETRAAAGTNGRAVDWSQPSLGPDFLRTLISGEFRIPDTELERLVTIDPNLLQTMSMDGGQWTRLFAGDRAE